MAIAVLLGLIVTTRLLKTRTVEESQTDTLNVTSNGLYLNQKSIDVEKLWARYSKIKQKRQLTVRIDTALPWGETWFLVDTLKKLSTVNPNLKIKGLEDVW